MGSKQIGQILLEAKPASGPGLTAELLQQGLEVQAAEGGLLGEILVRMRAVTEEQVQQALGKQLGIVYRAELKPDEVDLELIAHVPIGFAKQHRLLVIRKENDVVTVAIADPLEVGALDDLRAQLGAEIEPVLVPPQKILEVINEVYDRKQDKGGDLGTEGENEDEMAGTGEELVDILEITDEAPIIRWVNSLLFQRGEGARERYPHRAGRERGHRALPHRRRALRGQARAARQFMPSIIARMKIMAGLNIAEKRLPQDGRIRIKIAGKRHRHPRLAPSRRAAAASASSCVCSTSERCCSTSPTSASATTTSRSMDDAHPAGPHGIILVTGPTGSRQDDDALRVPEQDQHARPQHPHRRGSGRVRARRHPPDARSTRRSA